MTTRTKQPVLDLDELRAELDQVTYWPEYRFRLYQHPHEGIWICITADLPDALNQPGERTTINVRSAVPPIPAANYFHTWLLWRLERIGSHECREGYRVAGQLVFDPHAEGVNDG